MKAVVLQKPKEIELSEVDVPPINGDEVLIKVKATGICGSDIRAYKGNHPAVSSYPVTLGHEFSGEIADRGGDVEPFEVGARVVVEPLFVCGSCSFCKSGNYNLCPNRSVIGHDKIPGSFADYAPAKGKFVYPLPGELTFEEGALIEPTAVCVHAIKRANINVNDFVIILGAGTIGLLMIQIAKVAGAEVLTSELEDLKLSKAKQLESDYVVDPSTRDLKELVMELTSGLGADIVIDAAGTNETISQTVELVKRGGTIILAGFTGESRGEINLTKVTRSQINLLGTMLYNDGDFSNAIQLLQGGKVIVDPIITHRFSLQQVSDKFDFIQQNPDKVIKCMIT